MRAVAALRALTEQLEHRQVDNTRALGLSWQEIATRAGRHETDRASLCGPVMFERFSGQAREVVAQARAHARRLDHGHIGCEHLLLSVVGTGSPAGEVLRSLGLTPGGRRVGHAQILAEDCRPMLDREALAAVGIDLDVVREPVEAAF